MALQIFFPCYLGNNIVTTSNDLPTEMYKSNWIQFDQKQKQIVSIFLERTKRNSSIVAGNLFILNLQTFLSVIRFKQVKIYYDYLIADCIYGHF